MAMTIKLPPGSEARLARSAAASGRDVATCVTGLVRHFADAPTPIADLSGPVHRQFLDSAMTDDELAAELARAKHEMRAESRDQGGR